MTSETAKSVMGRPASSRATCAAGRAAGSRAPHVDSRQLTCEGRCRGRRRRRQASAARRGAAQPTHPPTHPRDVASLEGRRHAQRLQRAAQAGAVLQLKAVWDDRRRGSAGRQALRLKELEPVGRDLGGWESGSAAGCCTWHVLAAGRNSKQRLRPVAHRGMKTLTSVPAGELQWPPAPPGSCSSSCGVVGEEAAQGACCIDGREATAAAATWHNRSCVVAAPAAAAAAVPAAAPAAAASHRLAAGSQGLGIGQRPARQRQRALPARRRCRRPVAQGHSRHSCVLPAAVGQLHRSALEPGAVGGRRRQRRRHLRRRVDSGSPARCRPSAACRVVERCASGAACQTPGHQPPPSPPARRYAP